jgi:hypothetical protein
MPTVKLTAYFNDDDGRGWSETHHREGGTEPINLDAYLGQFDALCQMVRVPLLARDCRYLGCRASYRSADKKIRSGIVLHNPPRSGQQSFHQQSLWSAAPNTAVRMRMTNSTGTAASDVYLRGYWDELERGGYVDFVGTPFGAEWKSRADTFAAALIQAAYGWEGIDPVQTSRGAVINYTHDSAGRVVFTVFVTSGPALTPSPERFSVRFARINRSNSVLNRSFVCTIVDSQTIRTVAPVAAGPFEESGTFVLPRRTFIPYAKVAYYRLSQRKTGRPFGLAPGRLPARPLR